MTARQLALSAGFTGTLGLGPVTVTNPSITVTGGGSYTVDGQARLSVAMPSGGTFTGNVDLDYEGAGNFVAGPEADLSQWLGNAGAMGYIYYSSGTVNGFSTGDPAVGAVNLVPGVNFALDVALPTAASNLFSSIGLTPPGGSLTATGTANFSTGAYTLNVGWDAGAGGQQLFSSNGTSLALNQVGLQLTINAGTASFGLDAAGTLTVPDPDSSGSTDSIGLTGQITVSSLELDGSFTITNWANAFGISGLTVSDASLQVGIGWGAIPFPSIGLTGTVSSLPVDVAGLIGYQQGAPIAFAFNLDPIMLSVSIGTQGSSAPALEPLSIAEPSYANLLQVDYAGLTIAPSAVTIGTTTYPAG